MTQILLTGQDQSICVYLESNTVLPGTYVNAEYNIPEDYRIKQLNKLADAVNSIIAKSENTNTYIEKSNNTIKTNKQTTKGTISIDKTGTVYNFSGTTNNPNNISTYDDVIDHFTEDSIKFFVTGITDSKFSLIDKYFDPVIVSKIGTGLKPSAQQIQTNYVKTPDVTVINLEVNNDTSQLNLTKIINTKPAITPNINKSVIEQKPADISRFVGDSGGNTVKIQNDLSTNNLVRTKIKFGVPGVGISAMILDEGKTDNTPTYVLYLDTPYPIKYVDLGDGTTIFTYLRVEDLPELTANMILFDGYSEEPKIDSEVFIDRGVNSVFERVKKLKNITNLNELTKNGLGFYKINTRGYNFKNL